MTLACYACRPGASRGRRHVEAMTSDADTFAQDRDRIVHSTAFRRLVYKTQVFVNHEGDLFRTRLTHSIEVAQLARTMARALALNEDLVEAIALAHDLGHTPFGHAGQDALHDCMREHGGFEHNLQSLRVVDVLEARYPQFDGLNLSFETREGILKHCSAHNARQMERHEPAGVAHRFLVGAEPSLEAQLTNLADEMAYNAHDIDDGLRSGLLNWPQLLQVPLVGRHHHAALQEHPDLSGRVLLFETLRRMMAEQVRDVVTTTRAALQLAQPASADQVRSMPALVRLSAPMQGDTRLLKQMLMAALYRHPQVMHTTNQARQVVHELFNAYVKTPAEMSPEFALADGRYRAVADYVAGMTDRFASREYTRLTGGRAAFPALPARALDVVGTA